MRRAGILLLFALILSACGGGGGGTSATPSGAPKTGGTLKVAQETEIVTLDPNASGLLVEREIYYNMYDSLLGIDAKLNFVPQLAKSWQFPDDKTLVFNLRSDVKFHDGTPFNSEAVKFNIDRYMNDPKSVRKSDGFGRLRRGEGPDHGGVSPEAARWHSAGAAGRPRGHDA